MARPVAPTTPDGAPPPQGRRAESVLVLILRQSLAQATQFETLLLERQGWPGFWQSVTGALEWGENAATAARRELLEETGLTPLNLLARGVQRRFEIYPAYQYKYLPHTRFNLEYEFLALVASDAAVMLDLREHSRYQWVPLAQAPALTLSWSNRGALRYLHWELAEH